MTTALHILGDPAWSGGAALFLFSARARYVTGQTLSADGGGQV